MGTQLLTTNWNTLKTSIQAFLDGFGVLQVVEIILLFTVIFFVSKILRDNDATNLMVVYWCLLVGGGCVSVFAKEILPAPIFFLFVLLVSATMLLLFSMEVKQYFWNARATTDKAVEKANGGTEVVSQAETERCMTHIVKALQNMSKNNVGALIVLSKGALPKQVLQSGVSIDAEISTQMIEGVFFPKAPLHDGAMVIHGHKIQAAGCFLPLTQKTSYPKEYGTRHRAAIGITEVANVISLVVSEETGIISIVKQGTVIRYADYDMLVDALKDYYWHEMPLTGKKARGGNEK